MSAQLGFDWLQEARQERRRGTDGLIADLPRARKTDPKTSHDIGEHIRRTGQLRESQRAVLEAVRRWPGKTACELGALLDGTPIRNLNRTSTWWRFEVSRRAPELRAALLVKHGKPRECTVAGTPQTTWLPA